MLCTTLKAALEQVDLQHYFKSIASEHKTKVTSPNLSSTHRPLNLLILANRQSWPNPYSSPNQAMILETRLVAS